MKIVVAGATGFLGRFLCSHLTTSGHEVTVLTRDADLAAIALGPLVRPQTWLGTDNEWKSVVLGSDVVINLSGESIAGQRWSPGYKDRLRSSRIETTRKLVSAMAPGSRLSVFLSASAVGYYGDRGDEILTESSVAGTGFLADLCRDWEIEANRATESGVRVCNLRLGVVLGKGGALQKMIHPTPVPVSPWKLGLGGPMGSGRQWMSWIHVQDVAGLIEWAITHGDVSGVLNATSPFPVRNADFAHAIGKQLHRPAVLPFPGFLLRAMLGEFADTLLGGQRVLPKAVLAGGYRFHIPDLYSALKLSLGT